MYLKAYTVLTYKKQFCNLWNGYTDFGGTFTVEDIKSNLGYFLD